MGIVVAPVRILVVDDEELIARLLTGVLEGEGHEAVYVTDGDAALDRLQAEDFDLLVTDLRMPKMDGMRLIEEAKAVRPGLDALIMTGYASAETAVRALRHGVSDYLSKPFSVGDIKSAVGKCLERRRQRSQREQEVVDLSAKVESAQQNLEGRVADLSFLHDLTRLIADRSVPLRECLTVIARHFDADAVLLTSGDGVVERCGSANREEVLELAHRTAGAGLARLGRDAMAAPVSRGAVVACRATPFSPGDLRLLSITGRDLALAVENDQLRADQRRAYVGIVSTLIEAVEAKDRFNRGHSRRVSELASAFARRLGLPERERELLETAGKLHDIGKIGIPEEILNKPGRLTDEEFDVIKSHPVIGEQILMPLDFLAEARPVVRHHHERWDGRGYPDGLKGKDIPRSAALLSIVDSYDAMTSRRPYRDGMPPEKACAILQEGAGSQWDPDLVSLFRPA